MTESFGNLTPEEALDRLGIPDADDPHLVAWSSVSWGGNALKVTRLNATETGYEFVAIGTIAEPPIAAGTTAQYWRGDKSWQTLNAAAVANTPAGNIASTTVQAALNELDSEKLAASLLGAASGVAPLDSGSKVAAAYLPSYVDDVLEYANFAAFPGTGETGKIYVALDTNKTWRWSGSAYVEISPSPGSTDVVTEGSTNLYFTEARVRATPATGLADTAGTPAAADSFLTILGKIKKAFFTDHSGAGGSVHAAAVASGAAGFMSGADKAKLDGVASGATANDTDANLKARANHTGTQAISTILAAATARIFGRTTAGGGAGEELTGAQVRTLINEDSRKLHGTKNISSGSATNIAKASPQLGGQAAWVHVRVFADYGGGVVPGIAGDFADLDLLVTGFGGTAAILEALTARTQHRATLNGTYTISMAFAATVSGNDIIISATPTCTGGFDAPALSIEVEALGNTATTVALL